MGGVLTPAYKGWWLSGQIGHVEYRTYLHGNSYSEYKRLVFDRLVRCHRVLLTDEVLALDKRFDAKHGYCRWSARDTGYWWNSERNRSERFLAGEGQDTAGRLLSSCKRTLHLIERKRRNGEV